MPERTLLIFSLAVESFARLTSFLKSSLFRGRAQHLSRRPQRHSLGRRSAKQAHQRTHDPDLVDHLPFTLNNVEHADFASLEK